MAAHHVTTPRNHYPPRNPSSATAHLGPHLACILGQIPPDLPCLSHQSECKVKMAPDAGHMGG
jgi:hypothetical protein